MTVANCSRCGRAFDPFATDRCPECSDKSRTDDDPDDPLGGADATIDLSQWRGNAVAEP